MLGIINTDSISDLKKYVCEFRDKRDWKQYHKPKDLAISITIEAAELLELFQWLRDDEINELLRKPKFIRKVAEEMSDIMIYLLLLADVLNIDLGKSVVTKMKMNEEKFPVEQVKGSKAKIRLLEKYN